jgi:CxxC motif-containing protein (DUF1111 family)
VTTARQGGSFLAAAALGALLPAGSLHAQQAIQPRMGAPVAGLSPAEQARFDAGLAEFNTALTAGGGLGPIMNDESCGACHSLPLAGGSGSKEVTRFGKAAFGGNPFDPLESLGGSLLQRETTDVVNCTEVVPPEADVVINRITPSTFGAGLVEAIDDDDIRARELAPPPGVSGIAHEVQPVEGPPGLRVGRFGWKAQVATVLTFSADASLNELGLTNRFFGAENAPNGNAGALLLCDLTPDPEDGPFPARIDRQTDFQRFLAAPPQTPRSGMTGQGLFDGAGCASCHVSAPYVTTTVAEPSLSNKTIFPYADFLLHDMGALGDGIVQGEGTENEIRTPALWGLRVRAPVALLHDGRSTGGTAEENLLDAIAQHDGEGAAAASAFANLSPADQQLVLDFLMSLGRLEFDYEGNNNVDAFDWFFLEFDDAFTGPGSFFTPDAPAAVADFDQDGDFDLKDFGVLQRAMTGS